ncbi:serine protein kinase RIO [Candidatus Woesearchaeota archaeon]|nr:serine protein kinase RIO [Candidatus Woesearchaeota archaeon]
MPKHPRKPKDKFKVMHNVFDEFTNRTLFRLITRGYFEGLESPIAIGKEANIFSAKTKTKGRVMVKIYRLESCDFNHMYDYLKVDPRFLHLKSKKRKVILAWVQREYRNLLKAREANMRVPTPLAFLNNVVVLEFIGSGDEIAPRLKDKKPKNPKKFFEDVISQIKKLHMAGLVHADLSAFNILNFNEKPVFIDFSQCTTLKNPHAAEYLNRDVKNISTFFRKLGLKVDEEEIKTKILGKT